MSYFLSCNKKHLSDVQVSSRSTMNKTDSYSTISAIAVDLGAVNTGLVLTHGAIGQLPHEHLRQGLTLTLPEKGLQLSQKERLAKRHQRRGLKRRRLSKRLLQLMLKQHYSGSPEDFFNDFAKLRTFLNRRGYTYLTLEEVQGIVEDIESMDLDTRHEIVASLGAKCPLLATKEFMPQLEKTADKPLEFYQTLVTLCEETSRENKTLGKNLKKKLRSIQDYCTNILKSEKDGHKTRSQYLQNIRSDLKQPDYVQLAEHFGLTIDKLANLIGHIANLQLRVLRRYFNDPKMKIADYWDAKRLEKVFVRYLKAWHVRKSDQEYQNREKVLEYCVGNGIEKTLTELEPELTIPPFEDQNNRRPPTCASLHLDETKLDKEFPGWREWTHALVENKANTYELSGSTADEELEFLSKYYEKSAAFTKHRLSKGRDAILLQRLLDRSSLIDDYKFRTLVQVEEMVAAGEPVIDGKQRAYESGKKEIEAAIGTKIPKALVALAHRYYKESQQAKRGLWLPGETNNILFRCDRKPRQKKNAREELIGHILGVDLGSHKLWQTWEQAYFAAKTINSRSSLSSVCKGIEEARKEYGDEFHLHWSRIQRKNFQPNPANKIEKEVLKEVQKAKEAAAYIAKTLEHNAEQSKRYENPYSLAQIYNIMEGDIAGFHKTCPACTRENFWRSSPAAAAVPDTSGKIAARASRLAADTMRPFDGFLARYLERLGEKIAQEKWRQLSTEQLKGPVLLPILLEENRFRFNADMAEIKQAARRKKAQEKFARSEKREQDKWERIRKAGHGICPYTGDRVGAGGEFDHILPRSYSKSRYGTVFNSEMNLVYASTTGNQKKGDRRYTLKDLHSVYLRTVFGTDDTDTIKKQIAQTLAKYPEKNSVYFHDLDPQEQNHFRHALFDDELLGKVYHSLQAIYKMRVSGLQGYLARVIYHKLQKLNEQKKLHLHFEVFTYLASDTSLGSHRQNLMSHNKAYAKPQDDQQAPGSHVIDATMVWAEALKREDIPGLPSGLELEGDALEELLPDNLQIISLESRKQYRRKRPQSMPIFKDTIYAERYLALIVGEKKCGFGFNLKNMVEFDYEHLPWVFELLKPFGAFRGAPITETLEHYRKMLEQKKKYIYFNIVREKAAEFQQQHAYAPSLTPEQHNQMELLTGLRYFTIKKEIFAAMSDAQGKATAMFKESKDTAKFDIKVNFLLAPANEKKALRIAGKVSLPQLLAWENIAKDKTVSTFVRKGAKWQELTSSDEEDLIKRHFPRTVVNTLNHHGVRKVYSLPLPEGPSGGFRIQRRNGRRQFHVQGVEGAKFKGFTIRDGQVDFSLPAILPVLTKPNSLAPVDGYVGQPTNEFVFMDEWREIPLANFPDAWQGVERFWLQPNSEPRMRIRLQISNTVIAADLTAWHLTAPLAISTAKESEDKALAKLHKRLVTLLESINLKPRDKVNLVSVNTKSTVYEFIVQSTSSEMKAWYNTGH